MAEIEKASKFLNDFKENDTVTKITKNKDQIFNLLKILLKQINNDIDTETLNNLDFSQLWAFIYNYSSKSLTNFKQYVKNSTDILAELTNILNENTKLIKKNKKDLGKKRKRTKEEDDFNLEENEEEEKENEEENMNEDNEEIENEEEENENEENENEEIEKEEENEKEKEVNNKKKKNSKEKDMFFSLKDLNDFADQFEQEENPTLKTAPNKLKLSVSRKKDPENENEDEEGSLYEEDQEIKAEIDSEEDIKFDNFFDKPKKNSQNSEKNSDSENENEIFDQINEIEKKMLGKKDWWTKGEILGKERPKDALLSKAMDYEMGLKAPPIPDKSYTDKLEKMIKQRIIDDLFDDPIKKNSINLNEKKNPNFNLDFDKSKKGLAEIYEEKYLGNEKTETKIDQIKNDCEELCNQLFDMINQMTNGSMSSYGKIKKQNDINITNVPAIQIEEVGNFISDNKEKIKSGKELFNPNKIRDKNKEEMTSNELQTIHNRKKRNLRNRIHKKEKNRKLNELTQQLGSKFEAKIKMKQEKDKKMQKADKTNTTEYKSTKFFGKINEMAEQEDNKRKNKKNKE